MRYTVRVSRLSFRSYVKTNNILCPFVFEDLFYKDNFQLIARYQTLKFRE